MRWHSFIHCYSVTLPNVLRSSVCPSPSVLRSRSSGGSERWGMTRYSTYVPFWNSEFLDMPYIERVGEEGRVSRRSISAIRTPYHRNLDHMDREEPTAPLVERCIADLSLSRVDCNNQSAWDSQSLQKPPNKDECECIHATRGYAE